MSHPLSLAALTDRLYSGPGYPRPARGDKAAAALLRSLMPKVAAQGANLRRVSALGRGVPGYYRLAGDLTRIREALAAMGHIVDGKVCE